MNEKFPPTHEQVTGRESTSFFDVMVDDGLARYVEDRKMTNAEREIFEAQNRGDKVDEACWSYCKSGKQEEMGRAVNLRSLYAVRSLDAASATVVTGSEWKYDVPVLGRDQFWSGVDKAIFAYLRKYAQGRVSSEPLESHSEDGTIVEAEQVVANLNDHDVIRRTRRGAENSEPHHVEYVVVARY